MAEDNLIEKEFKLDSNLNQTLFYGVNNKNLCLLKNLNPNLQIVARGNSIKIKGEEGLVNQFISSIKSIEHHCLKNNTLEESFLIELAKNTQDAPCKAEKNLVLYGINGRSIVARTPNQQKLVAAFDKNDLIFAIGPAGTGKTYTAIALAVRALKNKEIRKIILSRPAVEAGEKLGFLPGDMKEKIDPYLQPLYDALQDMLPAEKLKELIERGIIQIAPLAFMRGRTLSDAVVILDEAQNTSVHQIKMFLTRMGLNSKMIVTGDMTQIDLPSSQKSGLKDALEVLQNIKGIEKIEFGQQDIIRHKLVQRIVEAYEKREA